MTGTTSIEWTSTLHPDGSVTKGRTWNPLTGCTRVSAGCQKCYAFALHDMRSDAYQRYDGIYPKTGKPMPRQYARPFSEIQLLPERLEDPLHIKTPQKIFVNSMSDLFHSQVPDEYIAQVFEVMRKANWHTFQVLTKRAGRLRRIASQLEWSPNIWIGVSIEADSLCPRADALREVPASLRFLSCEPLLGPLPSLDLTGISWVIVGAESGKGARYCDPDWIRDIRDLCFEHNVALFCKQMGTAWARANHRTLDTHGGNMDHWPADLRIRQFPLAHFQGNARLHTFATQAALFSEEGDAE